MEWDLENFFESTRWGVRSRESNVHPSIYLLHTFYRHGIYSICSMYFMHSIYSTYSIYYMCSSKGWVWKDDDVPRTALNSHFSSFSFLLSPFLFFYFIHFPGRDLSLPFMILYVSRDPCNIYIIYRCYGKYEFLDSMYINQFVCICYGKYEFLVNYT